MAIEHLTQTTNEWRRTDADLQAVARKNQSLTAELEGLTKEYELEHARRVTLERLAKDIATQRQSLVDNANAQAEEEKQKRIDLTKGLQNRLSEVNVQMEQTEQERIQLLQQNSVLREKLKVVNEYLENKDKQYAQTLEQKSKEVALYQEHMEERLTETFKSIGPMNTENELKSQLNLYEGKFNEFQSVIGQSTQAFDLFKTDMQKLNDRLAAAEREQSELRRHCDKVDVDMVLLVQAKQEAVRQREVLRKEKAALEAECRTRKKPQGK